MRYERQKGLTVSAALHFVLLMLLVFGLPSWLIPSPPPEPMAVTVELLPISSLTNIKPSETPPAPEPKKEEPPPPPKPPSPPVKTAEPTPPPPPKEDPLKLAKPDEKKPEPPKEKPKDEEKKKEKPKEDDLAAVLKAVKKTAQQQQKETDKKEKPKDEAKPASKAISSQYDPSMPLSISEKDAIRSQFAKCWSVPAGAKDAQNLIVLIEVTVEKDGTVTSVKLSDSVKSRYSSDAFYRAAAESAIRAVHQCSPLKNLPPEKYDTWKYMELTFDPKEMLL